MVARRRKFFTLDCLKQPYTAFFYFFYLAEKLNCIKELCQKSFLNILHYIMWNFAYTQEKIISTVKTL